LDLASGADRIGGVVSAGAAADENPKGGGFAAWLASISVASQN
jgi:hypothetical protein